MTHYSDHDKCACVEQMLELNKAASDFSISRYHSYVTPKEDREEVHVEVILRPDGRRDEVKLKSRGPLVDAVAEVYDRFTRILRQLPEFDPNKTLEHSSAKAVDDEVPF